MHSLYLMLVLAAFSFFPLQDALGQGNPKVVHAKTNLFPKSTSNTSWQKDNNQTVTLFHSNGKVAYNGKTYFYNSGDLAYNGSNLYYSNGALAFNGRSIFHPDGAYVGSITSIKKYTITEDGFTFIIREGRSTEIVFPN